MLREEDYLMLSGLQHFAFCRRQWALIHIEQQWAENFRTADGRLMHDRAHDSDFREKRGDVIITRAMQVSSAALGISGECDIVEFHKAADGIRVNGLDGTYQVIPVEYKRGKPKEDDCDAVQLCAQALCLEEMLCCEIPQAYLYYGETRRRQTVALDAVLRKRTADMIAEMHELFRRQHTPKARRTKACNACSLKDVCLPVLEKKRSAADYLAEALKGGDP
ncbi:MAG: CRISPR-associated protein Cas4 [Oscillospiraceae bacterium]|nr:CRISPR-associated protein Cas4 [Oscillospiraceae bacterium]MBR3448316.1 CRISPR-associated protein Cas4 [Oscillospiraceae bacterium]